MLEISLEGFMTEFEDLWKEVGKKLCGIWDVYASGDHKALLYRSIISTKPDEILAERERLNKLGTYKLVAVKMVYKEIVNRDPDNPRRTGCFRKTKWLAPNLHFIAKPKLIKEIEKYLEKESKWLSGGPRRKLSRL